MADTSFKLAFLDRMNKAVKNLRCSASELRHYAKSLDVVGNVKLADHLFREAECLEENAEELHKIIGEKIGDDMRETQEATSTMMHAVMAGLQVRT